MLPNTRSPLGAWVRTGQPADGDQFRRSSVSGGIPFGSGAARWRCDVGVGGSGPGQARQSASAGAPERMGPQPSSVATTS